MTLDAFHQLARRSARYLAIVLIVSIPVSTALTNTTAALLLLAWLASGELASSFAILRNRLPLTLAFALGLLFLGGMTWSSADSAYAFDTFEKYRELLLILPLFMILREPLAQRQVQTAFVVSMCTLLAASFLFYAYGLLTGSEEFLGNPTLKNRITHSVMIAFFSYYCLQAWIASQHPRKGMWLALAAICIVNLFFIVSGRTGQLMVLLLLAYTAWQYMRPKQLVSCGIGAVVLFSVYAAYAPQAIRIREGIMHFNAYIREQPETVTSEGLRMTFWRHSLEIIAKAPLLGHGTGSYQAEYDKVATEASVSTENPHNEFFLLAAQLGVVGLALFLAFLTSLWMSAGSIPDKVASNLGRGLVISIVINSMFNSTLLDHTEGHWFILLAVLFILVRAPAPAPVPDS